MIELALHGTDIEFENWMIKDVKNAIFFVLKDAEDALKNENDTDFFYNQEGLSLSVIENLSNTDFIATLEDYYNGDKENEVYFEIEERVLYYILDIAPNPVS
jgi:hypothetical protein